MTKAASNLERVYAEYADAMHALRDALRSSVSSLAGDAEARAYTFMSTLSVLLLRALQIATITTSIDRRRATRNHLRSHRALLTMTFGPPGDWCWCPDLKRALQVLNAIEI